MEGMFSLSRYAPRNEPISGSINNHLQTARLVILKPKVPCFFSCCFCLNYTSIDPIVSGCFFGFSFLFVPPTLCRGCVHNIVIFIFLGVRASFQMARRGQPTNPRPSLKYVRSQTWPSPGQAKSRHAYVRSLF